MKFQIGLTWWQAKITCLTDFISDEHLGQSVDGISNPLSTNFNLTGVLFRTTLHAKIQTFFWNQSRPKRLFSHVLGYSELFVEVISHPFYRVSSVFPTTPQPRPVCAFEVVFNSPRPHLAHSPVFDPGFVEKSWILHC